MDYRSNSSPDFRNNVPVEHTAGGNINTTETVVLSKILRQELNNAKEATDVHGLAIRCEELPELVGSPSDFKKLFQNIISLILEHPSVSSKQLLSIQCKEQLAGPDAAAIVDEKKTYAIQFHTNIVLEPYWQVTHQNQLKECKQIAAKYNGQFIINSLNSGCLFTLQLSAKSL